MAQSQSQPPPRNLKDLLREDQEPFHLPNYIADRCTNLPITKHRRQPQSSISSLHLQHLKRHQQQQQSAGSFSSKLICVKTACFLSSSFPTDSPADYFTRSKSPIVLLSPHNKSPIGKSPSGGGSSPSSHSFFLHVPAKTAALLLEAALRIQRSSSSNNSTSKYNKKPEPKSSSGPHAQLKNPGFGLLGSVIRRITRRNRTRKLEPAATTTTTTGTDDDDVVKWADSVMLGDDGDNDARRRRRRRRRSKKSINPERFDLVVDVQRWPDDDDVETAIDMGGVSSTSLSSASSSSTTTTTTTTSSSSNSCCSHSRDESDAEEEEEGVSTLVNREKPGVDGYGCDEGEEDFTFCPSPFRMGLYRTPSPDGCGGGGGFSSPAKIASRRFDHEEEEVVISREPHHHHQQEEDKEQNSPVSVLDAALFQEDDDGEAAECHADHHQSSTDYEFLQRPNHPHLHLLRKLRNFEKLADHIEPVELDYDQELESEQNDLRKPGMKRLVSDLIFEEHERAASQCSSSMSDDTALVMKRVCQRLESWEEIMPDTISMMVALDLKREGHHSNSQWRVGVCRQDEQDRCAGVATEVEHLILQVLVDEFIYDELQLY